MTVSQLATVLLTLVSAVVTFYLDSIAGAWKLLLVTGAGTGSVLLLRWYWWRINAWSEVSAMICGVRRLGRAASRVSDWIPTSRVDFAWIMIITVAITTVVWLAATFADQARARRTAALVLRANAAVVDGVGTDRA